MITTIVKFHTKKDGVRQENVDFLFPPRKGEHIFDTLGARYYVVQVQHHLAVGTPGGEQIHSVEFETIVIATPA